MKWIRQHKQNICIFSLFSIALVLFSVFTPRLLFTDVSQYVSMAKAIAGTALSFVNLTRGLIFSIILSPISSSFIAMKLFSSLLLALIGLILFIHSGKRSVLLLWFLSPLVWFLAPQITPLLLSSLFFTIGYLFWKKYESKEEVKHLLLSGVFVGGAAAIWEGAIIITLFFVLAFMLNRTLKEVIYFLALFFAVFSLNLIANQFVFGFSLQSIIRTYGANFAILLSGTPYQAQDILLYSVLQYFLFFVIISPLIIFLYRIHKTKCRVELYFIILSLLFFILNAQYRYLIIVAPITILSIDKITSNREKAIGLLISILMIIGMGVWFADDADKMLVQDLEQIGEEFPDNIFFVGNNEIDTEAKSNVYNALYRGDNIKGFVSYYDHYLDLNNKTRYFDYHFASSPRIELEKELHLQVYLSQNPDMQFEDIDYLILRQGREPPGGFELIKKYNLLDVYKKIGSQG